VGFEAVEIFESAEHLVDRVRIDKCVGTRPGDGSRQRDLARHTSTVAISCGCAAALAVAVVVLVAACSSACAGVPLRRAP
jgi:hypothetical protein